jgi:hypothetical protein
MLKSPILTKQRIWLLNQKRSENFINLVYYNSDNLWILCSFNIDVDYDIGFDFNLNLEFDLWLT